MQLAPVARSAPMRIAETLVAHFERPASIAEVSIAAPGFMNLRMDHAWVAAQVEPIRDAGASTAAIPWATLAASTSSSSAPTRPARCISATRGAPSSGTSCPGS